MQGRLTKLIPVGLFVFAISYYYLLSAKLLTWVYTSGDAGDWLVLTNWWHVPHQWGKPLIVLYIRLLAWIPGDDVIKTTVALAIIPGAITVVLTYSIVKHLTNKISLALIASAVLLGAAIFTTQATVLEQYTFTAMFLTAAVYFHVRENKALTMLFLGLTTATHIVGLPITFLWLVCGLKEWRAWGKVIPIYIVFGILPYGLIFYLMANPDIPKLVSGGLSWQSINSYLGNTASGVNLALVEAPRRLFQATQIYAITLGLAIVPMVKGLISPGKFSKLAKLSIVIICFIVWFYITNLFPSVWKWSTLILPLAAIFVAIGLDKLPRWHYFVVALGAIALIITNGFLMNTDRLARADPQATEYMEALQQLPDNSCVVIPRGGQYGFTLFYVMSEGQKLIPLAQGNPFTGMGKATLTISKDQKSFDQSYADYLIWLENTYGIKGDNMYDIVQFALDNGYNVYYGQPVSEIWSHVFMLDSSDKKFLQRVVSINHNPDFSKWGIE